MRERTAGDRVRVAIAGTIYAKRALVRRFLEDDGFAVVAAAKDPEGLFSALRSSTTTSPIGTSRRSGGRPQTSRSSCSHRQPPASLRFQAPTGISRRAWGLGR